MRLFRLFLVAVLVMCSHLASAQPVFGLQYTTELQADLKGGLNIPGLLRLEADVPVGNSVSFQAACISIGRTHNGRLVDDFQVFSNIEEENLPFGMAVMDVAFRLGDRHELHAGVRNINEDYFTSPVTSLFTNSSCGVFPTISANYDIANYPLASFGIHYSLRADKLCVLTSVYNGCGYNSLWGNEHVFQFNPVRDGMFVMGQMEFKGRGTSNFLGACLHSGNDMVQCAETVWGYTECTLSRDLSLIAGCSHAFGSQVSCSDFLGLGFQYAIPKAELGLYTDYARMDEGYECATELTCRIHISEHIDLQPTIHGIVQHPIGPAPGQHPIGPGKVQKEMKTIVSLLRLSVVI